MMKKIIFAAIIVLAGSGSVQAQASILAPQTYKVGIFAPLYLDSVFSGTSYRYNRKFPKFVLPGLDFIQGAQIALDSLQVLKGNIAVSFYDTKATDRSISQLVASHQLDSIDLIIGSVKDYDYLELAELALKRNVPFISATYPNDAGVTSNPFVVIVNSTLKAHCEAIYSYILQNHGSDQVILVTRPGSQESRIAEYFKTINEPDGKPLLKIQTVSVNDNFLVLENKIDTSRQSVIIGGSLDEKFALKLANVSATYNNTSPIKLIGMPNWDGFALRSKNTISDFPVYFTSPYYNVKWDSYSRMVKEVYLKKYKGNPSDMSFKGFEIIYMFTSLLDKHPRDFMSHLNEHSTKIFNEYNFKPVFLTRQSVTPDYFENKHLYFIRALNGATSRAW